MEETRKFLRYVTPGVIFAIETTILLLPIFPTDMMHIIKSLQEDKSLGIVLALLLASGAIGFILSIIHHCAYWRIRFYPRHDYARWTRFEKQLKLTRAPEYSKDSPQSKFGHFFNDTLGFRFIGRYIFAKDYEERKYRWIEITALWYQKADDKTINNNTHQRANSLADLVHSSGTAFIASLASIFVAGSIIYFNTDLNLGNKIAIQRSFLSLLAAIFFFFMHHLSYRTTLAINQEFLERILCSVYNITGDPQSSEESKPATAVN
jgi:hypothetical protein